MNCRSSAWPRGTQSRAFATMQNGSWTKFGNSWANSHFKGSCKLRCSLHTMESMMKINWSKPASFSSYPEGRPGISIHWSSIARQELWRRGNPTPYSISRPSISKIGAGLGRLRLWSERSTLPTLPSRKLCSIAQIIHARWLRMSWTCLQLRIGKFC